MCVCVCVLGNVRKQWKVRRDSRKRQVRKEQEKLHTEKPYSQPCVSTGGWSWGCGTCGYQGWLHCHFIQGNWAPMDFGICRGQAHFLEPVLRGYHVCVFFWIPCFLKSLISDFPGGPGDWDSMLTRQGTQVWSLHRELDPAHCSQWRRTGWSVVRQLDPTWCN